MFVTPAFAQAAGAAPGSADFLIQFAPFILIFVIMYFLLIRPQQRKAKEHRNMLQSLKRNDRIVTAGGIVGVITKVKEGTDEVEVEIAPNVRVNVLRGTIGSVVRPTAANDTAVAKG